jgi:hypothetical protein
MTHFDNRAPMGALEDTQLHRPSERVATAAEASAASFLVPPRRLERRWAAKIRLRRTLLIAAMSILSSVTATAASTSSNLHKRHAGRAGEVGTVEKPRTFEPPRMIEVRPGMWISSYDCITDEGQGRWWPCSSLGQGR